MTRDRTASGKLASGKFYPFEIRGPRKGGGSFATLRPGGSFATPLTFTLGGTILKDFDILYRFAIVYTLSLSNYLSRGLDRGLFEVLGP